MPAFASMSNKPNKSYEIWNKLRMPFVIPCDYSHLHECEWEVFDFGHAGCRKCGAHHVCLNGSCVQLEHTSEGTFCLITGMCIREKNFVANEFDDTYPTYVRQRNMAVMPENNNIVLREHIDDHIQCFFAKEQTLHKTLLHQDKGRLSRSCEDANNLWLDDDLLKQLMSHTQQAIGRLVCICKCKLKMKIKNAEIRNICIGLMYLMKTGIRVHDVCILPHVEAFKQLLPMESTLAKRHDFKPKFITDVENKFKFFFRDVDAKQFIHLGLHLKSVDDSI